MSLGNKSYNLINHVYFPINGATKMVFVAWTIELSMWAVLVKNLPNLSSKCGSVGHFGINDMSMLIPQVFNGFKVRTLGRLFHPLLALWGWALSSWRMKFWPGLWGYGIATGWRILPQYLSALRSHPIITCLSSEVDVTPPSHYLHQKFLPYQCTTQHNVLSIFSTLWPYGPTTAESGHCSDSSAYVSDTSANRPDGKG